jgi:hypothetical protein
LKGIENLVKLTHINCIDNKLTILEGFGIFIKLISNNRKITNNIRYNFIDFSNSDEHIELNRLLDNLKNFNTFHKFNEHFEKLKNMFIEFCGFEKHVLK